MKQEPNYLIWLGLGGLVLLGGGAVIDLKKASENEKKFAPYIAAAEKKHGIPTGLLHRLIKAESSFKTNIINGLEKSPKGALGIAQFMPDTAKQELGSERAALDPLIAIDGAARYLKKIYNYVGKDWTKTVAGYNWGMGAVKNFYEKGYWVSKGKRIYTLPEETRLYVAKIMV